MRPNNGLNRYNDDRRPSSGLRRINQAIDRIPTRTKPGSPQRSAATHVAYPELPPPTASSEWRNGSQYSTQSTTDSTFEPSVFDNLSDGEDLGNTQTTVGWDPSQDDKRFNLCEDSYSPTLSESDALEVALSQYESQSQLSDFSSSCNTRDDQSPSPTPSTNTTYFSPLPVRSSAVLPGSGAGTESNRDLSPTPNRGTAIASSLEDRLELVWPQLPVGLQRAPLPVVWEFMRAALYCSVNTADISVRYEEEWLDQEKLWAGLKAHPAFEGRRLPEKCDARAWNSSVHNNFRWGPRAVVLTASMSMSQSGTGPVMVLELHPLKLEQSCRLHRRFGSDRFLDLRMPTLNSRNFRDVPGEGLEDIAARWLTRNPHAFLGRSWAAFWVRSEDRLSKTTPVVVFQEHQICHLKNDIKSPIGRVMNDGIGRVSPSVMRKIRDELGLSDIPCAVQARFGSAKGMWITDVTDSGQEDWIETYPKQRKWDCNWSDEFNRTLEVKSWASPRKSANLNLQFLAILEDRARDKLRMRNTIGKHLAVELERDLGSMKVALKHPELFRQWAREASSSSSSRVHNREVPFLAGLPYSAQDNMCFLADGGFDPMRQEYLQKLVFRHQRQKCERLETALIIKIARSTYALMVVDFLGVLKPNEVQLCFSSNFDDGFSQYSDLDGIDVLVARSPAHLLSDIQKVRAVFKPELRHLKDVIIFPRTGDIPLADMLSGGDYDGDIAWVCWEPDIVDNFENELPPPKPDFSPYLERDEDTLEVLSKRYGEDEYIDSMIEKAFAFSLKPKMLGICTSYKGKLAYHRNNIGDKPVVALSWFLSELADQAKSGIIFGEQQWALLRNDFVGEKGHLPEPAYKSKVSTQWAKAEHIIDHLRFVVARGVIERELRSLNDFNKTDPAYSFDADLAGYWDQFEKAAGQLDDRGVPRSGWLIALRQNLKTKLEECFAMWRTRMSLGNDSRPDSVLEVYDHWRGIEPSVYTDGNNKEHRLTEVVAAFLQQPGTHPPELSQWQLLKASLTFREFHTANANFVWRVAGRQLQFIKALRTGCHGGGPPVPVVPRLYAALRPDNKYIKRVVARGDRGGVSEAVEGPAEGGDVDEFEDWSDLESALADLEDKEVTAKSILSKETAINASSILYRS
ncbi:hypothetical protein DL766_005898 [Monosporascus sp. MC13-8B]|uniref:RNA-dependent RNA polymerase n=1 Tax=Monosporascus cannonballus TaxID=155416 RepID=A0ABY0GQU2_9PEZI|nr:hypothetical protein DL762_010609 [Monosporascus cannonballus]RYO88860.1 hypothetical protein DL763_005823 [Monosporascus cannonballus]RYP28400.1 hypothetical protein DL766_005898 [Monosporascus sp. MC13-8B]